MVIPAEEVSGLILRQEKGYDVRTYSKQLMVKKRVERVVARFATQTDPTVVATEIRRRIQDDLIQMVQLKAEMKQRRCRW